MPTDPFVIPHFRQSEFTCQCGCDGMAMTMTFLSKLSALRAHVGIPLHVSSAYRCATHNAAVSATGNAGPHTTGQAIDLRVSGTHAYTVLTAACAAGWLGIGIHQTGAHSARFLHLDLCEAPHRPRVWSY